MLYKAFISHSHAADGRLAPALRRALHRIAKPWYRLRTMRVFRDETNLAASPGLLTAIELALRESEYFIYLASPTAANSPWVQKETDIRWAHSVDQLSLRHSLFRAAILELAATLLDRPKGELDGDDVRLYRHTRRVAWSAADVLARLTGSGSSR